MASVSFQGEDVARICPSHKEDFKFFCRTDQICICCLCVTDDHKDHEIVKATEECTHKKKALGQSQRRCQQIIQLKEKELQEQRKAVKTLKSDANTAEEECLRIFNEMMNEIVRRRYEVTELIRAQEKAEVSQAEELLKRLEQEIAELKRTDAEMKQLSLTEDPVHFLKNMESITDEPSVTETKWTFNQSSFFVPLKSALKMQLKEKLHSIFEKEMDNIYAAANKAQILKSFDGQTPPEPVTREDFLRYSCHFTLDPNTAHTKLHLPEGNRRVEWRDEDMSYPDHPNRFDVYPQVLCREGMPARCYWEVEWNGGVGIAVSYKSISREGVGVECGFGYNDQSWMLGLRSSSSYFSHRHKETELPLVASSRIGVYVDHRAGTLAFYSISGDAMTLLHIVHTTFTHTLYPGFGFYDQSINQSILFI